MRLRFRAGAQKLWTMSFPASGLLRVRLNGPRLFGAPSKTRDRLVSVTVAGALATTKKPVANAKVTLEAVKETGREGNFAFAVGADDEDALLIGSPSARANHATAGMR